MLKRIMAVLGLLACPILFAACNGSGFQTTCGDSFQKTTADYDTDQTGIYLTRDQPFANGTYDIGPGGTCSDLGAEIVVVISDDGTTVTVTNGGAQITGTWSDDDKAFSMPAAAPRTCLLTLTKNAVNCLKGASYVCETPACTNVYLGK